jgi:hypothetical protein
MSADDIRRANAFLAPRPTPPAAARIRRWQPFRNPAGTMLGYLSAELPSGMIVNDCRLMIGPSGKPWIAIPSAKQVNKDGSTRLDARGRQTYSQIVEFRSRALADRFSDLVLEALRRQHPEALDGGAS